MVFNWQIFTTLAVLVYNFLLKLSDTKEGKAIVNNIWRGEVIVKVKQTTQGEG